MTEAPQVNMQTIAKVPSGVRLQFDKARDTWMLLAPERAVKLDQIAAAILQEVDGTADIESISASLAEKYNAPVDQISNDVIGLIQTLREKRMLETS